MARKKSNKLLGTFQIFFSSIKTYFLYLDQCAKKLAFPIFGQVFSLILIFSITFFFITNINDIKNINSFFSDEKNLLIALLIIILPLILVFLKAFFNYIIAFASLNILFFTASKTRKSKNIDFEANNNVIKRKFINYVILLLFTSVSIIFPPILIFLALTYQVFALEGDISAPKAYARSIELVKGNVFPTIIMLLLCYFTTYLFLPELLMWLSEKISLTTFAVTKFEIFATILPINEINGLLSMIGTSTNATEIAMTTFSGIIWFLVIGFTLPFRCCCFTELYRMYDSDKIKEFSKSTDEIIVRATGKKGKN